MTTYSDIDPTKKAFIFELDNVLYPEKDYLLQVYYLFAQFIEFTEAKPSSDMIAFIAKAYEQHGAEGMFDSLVSEFGIAEKYRANFNLLHKQARLPLKLLLFDSMLKLLQAIVGDNKQVFIVTNSDPEQQLNKIKQMEWNGLERSLVLYFAEEVAVKPAPDVIDMLVERHQLKKEEVLVLSTSTLDEMFANNSGVDFMALILD